MQRQYQEFELSCGDVLTIGDGIAVQSVHAHRGGQRARIGVTAPADVEVDRLENRLAKLMDGPSEDQLDYAENAARCLGGVPAPRAERQTT